MDDATGPVAGYLVTETEGPDKGWDKEWMQGERETNVIGLYRTEEDAKAAAEATVFDWLKRMDFQDQVVDAGYWQDHVDAEIFNDASKKRDYNNKAKARQLFIQWLIDNIRNGFVWNARRDGVTLNWKNPFDENDFHEYFIEIKPMRFSRPPSATSAVPQVSDRLINAAADQVA